MKDILETIVKHLVENQDAVKITEVTKPENENLIEFKVNVAKEDMGKIIGNGCSRDCGTVRILYEKSAKGFPVFDTDSAVWTEHDRADRDVHAARCVAGEKIRNAHHNSAVVYHGRTCRI